MHKRILAVDDDADTLSMLDHLLTQNDYEVKILTHAERTFETVDNFKPDLILMNVLMGGLDGKILCSALKAYPATRHIPVIFVSSYNRQAISDVKADDFLQKPVDAKQLLNKISRQLTATAA